MDGMKIDESLIPKFIGIVVAIIIIALVLVPVLSDASQTNYNNSPIGNGITLSETDTFTITKEENSLTMTIDGNEFTSTENVVHTILFSNEMIINCAGLNVFIIYNGTVSQIGANVNTSFNATCVDGECTYKIGEGAETTISLTDCLVYDPDGDLIEIVDNSAIAHISNVNQVYSWTIYGDWAHGNGVQIVLSNGESVSNAGDVTTTIDSDGDTISKGDISWEIGGVAAAAAAANDMIVPKNIVIENKYATLYAIIPILVVLAILISVVNIFVKRDYKD